MNKLLLTITLSVCLVNLLCSCHNDSKRIPWNKEAGWHTGLPSYDIVWDFFSNQLNNSKVSVIPAEKQKEAQMLLHDTKFVKLSLKEAAALEITFLPNAVEQIYLIRAVFLRKPTSNFTVYTRGLEVLVYNVAMGSFPVPMKNHAVAVLLTFEPSNVYSICTMVE